MPLRVLDFGVAWRLGSAPTGTRSAIAGIPVYVISLKNCEARRQNTTERLGALDTAFQFVDAIDGGMQRLWPSDMRTGSILFTSFTAERARAM